MTDSPLEFAEGADVLEVIRQILAHVGPVLTPGDPSLVTLRHTEELAARAVADGFAVRVEIERPRMSPTLREILIPVPLGPAQYATILHEFGHVYGHGQAELNRLQDAYSDAAPDAAISFDDPRFPPIAGAIIEAEIGAWKWAMEQARVWTPGMGAFGAQALCSYVSTAVKAPEMGEFFGMIEKLARRER